jgi:glycosidase
MNEIAKGEKNVQAIYQWMKEDNEKHQKGLGMYFTSNHDENAWAGTEFERMGDAHKVMTVLAYTFDGIPLMYSGQEEPLKRRLSFFGKDDIGFRAFEYEDFYKTLMDLKKSNEALYNGEYGAKASVIFESDHVFAFQRTKNNHDFVAYLNLSDQAQEFKSGIDSEGMKDPFTNEEISLKNENLIKLEPWGYKIISK